MKKAVYLNKTECVFKKVRRSKHIRIILHQDGRVIVTAPYYCAYKQMERFLDSKKEWIQDKLSNLRNRESLVPAGGAGHYKKYKEQARAFIRNRLEYFNRFYKFEYNRVSIRNQKTRWGSCSAQGNLNFSYKLLFLPPEQADYIIAHELCHLKEMNHSKQFWSLVSKTIPNYTDIRKGLKKFVV